ncbi:MAG: bifunctional tetrahydrofolate synthase/dihydrofolate synthase [Methylococcaceae bacterium]|nr:bifunctional tetrahydrofolate synthase/dihydrofolate synthase [Methylococcaceae bacterium]
MHFDSLQEWLAWQEGLHSQVIDLGLERVNAVYSRLLPAGNHTPTLTVAGTNGKGSCIALLSEIYQAQGYRVGAFTSPHILQYNERICINGQPVSDALLCTAFERIEACRNDVSLSFFEFSTLAALDIFSRENIDVQLLEVGLGGRLDAVNIVAADVAIISSIGIDHADWLGDTREAIAIEKAGIFRAAMPAIIGDPCPPVTLIQAAKDCGAQLCCINQDFHYQCLEDRWVWQGRHKQYLTLPFPALKGKHQFLNAAAVLAAIEQMQERLPVNERAICLGLMGVNLNGRFQFINSVVPVLLDVGHNPQAVGTLFEYVTQTFPHKRLHAVFAMMKDKDIRSVIEIMQPLVYDWVIAPLDNSRAASTPMLQAIFEEVGVARVMGDFVDFKAAFKYALHNSTADDLIVVFGSFFLVSAYLAEFGGDAPAINAALIKQALQTKLDGTNLIQDAQTGEAMCQ